MYHLRVLKLGAPQSTLMCFFFLVLFLKLKVVPTLINSLLFKYPQEKYFFFNCASNIIIFVREKKTISFLKIHYKGQYFIQMEKYFRY